MINSVLMAGNVRIKILKAFTAEEGVRMVTALTISCLGIIFLLYGFIPILGLHPPNEA
jgi:hypothetical protein